MMPSSAARSWSCLLAGATFRVMPLAMRRPFSTLAAAARSTYFAPVQAPI